MLRDFLCSLPLSENFNFYIRKKESCFLWFNFHFDVHLSLNLLFYGKYSMSIQIIGFNIINKFNDI